VRTTFRFCGSIATSLAILSVAGCSRNPNVEIVGSYFPGWMLSLALGIALTLGAHTILRRHEMDRLVGPPAILYPSMVVLFTCLLWLCFFA
jgi:hypothetical protein